MRLLPLEGPLSGRLWLIEVAGASVNAEATLARTASRLVSVPEQGAVLRDIVCGLRTASCGLRRHSSALHWMLMRALCLNKA